MTAMRRRSLCNLDLFVPRDRLPPIEEADTYYHADLIGLAVVKRRWRRARHIVGHP